MNHHARKPTYDRVRKMSRKKKICNKLLMITKGIWPYTRLLPDIVSTLNNLLYLSV